MTVNRDFIDWKTSLPRYAKMDSLIFGGKEVSWLTKTAFLRRLSNTCEGVFKGSDQDADSLRNELNTLYKPFLKHPYLCQVAEDIVESYINRRNFVYDLPDCEASALLKKITEPYRGKWVVIDFWSMTCGPCRSGIVKSLKMREELRDSPLVDFVFFAEDQSPDSEYDEFVTKNLNGEDCQNLTHQQYCQMMELFRFNGIPHYELMDPQGRIVIPEEADIRLGYSTKEEFVQKLESLGKILGY